MRNVRNSFEIAPEKERVDYVSFTSRLRVVYVFFTRDTAKRQLILAKSKGKLLHQSE